MFAAAALIILGTAQFAVCAGSENSDGNAPLTTNTIAGFSLVVQHKDTAMNCVAGCGPAAHGQNDASGVDTLYGTVDDCPHCSCYCAPAGIAMVSAYRGITGNSIKQDYIYDHGKSTNGETLGDGILQTHGVGMYDTQASPEVQVAFTWSIGIAIVQHDTNGANPNGPLTGALIIQYITVKRPILWCDHTVWPAHQSASYPPSRTDQGHVKVITGYDDSGTPLNYADDLYLIYDPWPEYNDKGVLPAGAAKGPGNTWDPYWIPSANVFIGHPTDIHLVDTFPSIGEFPLIILPAAALAIVAVSLPVFLQKRE
jgi:hypothetical protein